MKLKSVVSAVLLATSASAFAVTVDFGAHGLLESSGFVSVPTGPFADIFKFTLGQASFVDSIVASLGGVGSYALYSGDAMPGGLPEVSLAGYSYGVTNSITLGAGSYYYVVSGLAFSPDAYYLSSAATAAPVPEPETYAMMLAGLAAIGFVASRRRQQG